MNKTKRRSSMIAVIIIFFLIYFGEIAATVAIFYYILQPKIKDFQQQKITQPHNLDNTGYKKESGYQQKPTATPLQSNTNKTTTPVTSTTTTFNYTQQDINDWKTEIDHINSDLQTTQQFFNNPSYNQSKIQRLNTLLTQMKVIASNIYGKMNQKQMLTTQDQQDIKNYNNYFIEEQSLVKESFH